MNSHITVGKINHYSNMKHQILYAGMAVAVTGLLQSCTDNAPIGGNAPLDPGTEIRFGAVLEDSEIKSRTVYGDEINSENATVWPIYWNYPDNLDQIFIYSPQGDGARNQATYTVNPGQVNQPTAATITKVGAFGVQVGTSATYDFYALYPASANIAPATGTTITGTLTSDQNVTYAGTKDTPGSVVPSEPQVNAKYVMAPDMTSCLMTAESTGVVLTENTPVSLTFKPFSSVIDITIPGPVDNNTITGVNKCAVTMVQVVADAPIAGNFTYDFSTKSFTFDNTTSTNIINVNTRGFDADGNEVGIPMTNDNTLRLQAFLLPNPDVKEIKVLVYTSDSQVWTKSLVMNSGTTVLFKPSQIHKVVLPKLRLAEAPFDYSMWLSQLDPRIYITDISLPGTTSSFSYGESGDSQMQTLDLAGQFDAGARVFRCSIGLYDNSVDGEGAALDGGSTHFGINVNGGNQIMRMTTAVQTLCNEMAENRGNEFCVLMVSDNQSNIDYPAFYARFKTIADKLVADGYLPEKIDANTTIEDVKGKVILKLQLNGNGAGSDGGGSTSTQLNNILAKVQGWSGVDGARALFNWWTERNGTTLFYAPMVFGNIGSFEYTGFVYMGDRAAITSYTPGMAYDAASRLIDNANRSGGIWSSNFNTTSVPTDLEDHNKMWYIYGAQARAGENYSASYGLIEQAVNAIKNTYGSTSHNRFYMTYLGGAGGRASVVSTYYTVDQITNNFVTRWNTLTAGWGEMPYGWVLFNRVPAEGSTNLSSAETLVQNAVRKVISQNNDVNFKLQRDKSRTLTTKVAPDGDVVGTHAGGSIF